MRIAQAPRLVIISCFTVSVLAFPQLGSTQTKPAGADPAKEPIVAAGIDVVKITLYDAMAASFTAPASTPKK